MIEDLRPVVLLLLEFVLLDLRHDGLHVRLTLPSLLATLAWAATVLLLHELEHLLFLPLLSPVPVASELLLDDKHGGEASLVPRVSVLGSNLVSLLPTDLLILPEFLLLIGLC